MLLHYAKLTKDERPVFYQRVRNEFPPNVCRLLMAECVLTLSFMCLQSKGVTFSEVQQFFNVLHSIEQLEMALGLYALAGVPVGESMSRPYSLQCSMNIGVTTEDFKRAAKAVSGEVLSDHLIHVIFVLFDSNGAL